MRCETDSHILKKYLEFFLCAFFTVMCLEGFGRLIFGMFLQLFLCGPFLFSFQRHSIFPSSDCCERQDVYDTEHVRYLKKRKKAEGKKKRD